MMSSPCKILFWGIYFIGAWSVAKFNENIGDDSEYGTKWMFFVDDYGATHILNFSLNFDRFDIMYGNVYFYLYTRYNVEHPELLKIPCNETLLESVYLKDSRSLVVLTHGWFSNYKATWLQNIKDSILLKYDANVITVDWSELSDNPLYHWAALSTKYVGRKLATLLHSITESYSIQGRDIHLIGHSLGAHVMGYTGMFSSNGIQRITGLDPARPLFELPLMPDDFRLEKSDAEFVDIIHTCGGLLGYKFSYGHADFYPNGGEAPQSGCEGLRAALESCSHGRSCLYFEESIGYEDGKGFVSYPCKHWKEPENNQCRTDSVFMGFNTKYSKGDYYLCTRNQSKFAIDDDK